MSAFAHHNDHPHISQQQKRNKRVSCVIGCCVCTVYRYFAHSFSSLFTSNITQQTIFTILSCVHSPQNIHKQKPVWLAAKLWYATSSLLTDWDDKIMMRSTHAKEAEKSYINLFSACIIIIQRMHRRSKVISYFLVKRYMCLLCAYSSFKNTIFFSSLEKILINDTSIVADRRLLLWFGFLG